MPLPPGSQLLEIPVPEAFRGCWQGQVATLDSREVLSGWQPAWLTIWLPKSYEICFVKRGLDNWELTYSWSRIDPTRFPIRQLADSIRVMRGGANSLFLETKMQLQDAGQVKDETNTIKLETGPGSVMHATAAIVIDRDKIPWMAATWHCDFTRVPRHIERREADGSITVLNP